MNNQLREDLQNTQVRLTQCFSDLGELHSCDINSLQGAIDLYKKAKSHYEAEAPEVLRLPFWTSFAQDVYYPVSRTVKLFNDVLGNKKEEIAKEVQVYFGRFKKQVNAENSIEFRMKKISSLKELNEFNVSEAVKDVKADLMVKHSSLFEILKDLDENTFVSIDQLKAIDEFAADYFENLAFEQYVQEFLSSKISFGDKASHFVFTPGNNPMSAKMRDNQILIVDAQAGSEAKVQAFQKGDTLPSSFPGLLHNNTYVVTYETTLLKRTHKIKVHLFDDVFSWVEATIFITSTVAQVRY